MTTRTDVSAAPTLTRGKRAPARRPAERKSEALTALKTFLDDLGFDARPSVHVNGRSHSGAVLTVDFGTPLKPQKMTSDQSTAFADVLRSAAAEVSGRVLAALRVHHDGQNGIVWVSAS